MGAYNPNWEYTKPATLHYSHLHSKSIPRFAGSPTGTTTACVSADLADSRVKRPWRDHTPVDPVSRFLYRYWLTNGGNRIVSKGVSGGILPAVHRVT